MTRAAFFVAALGSLLGIGSSPAHASEPLVVTPARTEGELGDAARDQLEARLHEVVRKSQLDIVEVSDELGRRAAGCDEDRCRAELIAEGGARFLLVPEIALDDRDYRLRLTLYAADGTKAAQVEETCGLCGLAEAADLMADLGARIGRKVEVTTRASSVEVRSDPAGAKVFVADVLVGTTPLEVPLDAGVHSLRIELDGYIALQRKVEVVAGESTTLELGLQPVPSESDQPPSGRAKLFAGLGWTALAAGTGALAGGVTLMVIDERPITSDCSGVDVDGAGNCRWRYATLEGGIGLAVGGAALIGTAVALLVVGRKQSRAASAPPRTAARVEPSWAGLTLKF